MTQHQVTVDVDTVQQVLQRDDGSAELVRVVLDQILDAQATEQLQAERYERTEQRQDYRNGTRPRRLSTRVGSFELGVPQVRAGEFLTELFARHQCGEQALLLALMEIEVDRISTRKVQRITEELCGTSFSKLTISALCQRFDPLVHAWHERHLSGQVCPFLIVDALVIKVRAQRVLLMTGGNRNGYREALGLQVGEAVRPNRAGVPCSPG